MDEVIDLKAAKNFLSVSEWKIRELVGKKQIPFFRVGRRILFRRSKLIDWIEEREQRSCQD